MKIYKKIKKEFTPIDNSTDVKIGDIVKVYSSKKNKFITEGLFVIKIINDKIYLQSCNSLLVFEMGSGELSK